MTGLVCWPSRFPQDKKQCHRFVNKNRYITAAIVQVFGGFVFMLPFARVMYRPSALRVKFGIDSQDPRAKLEEGQNELKELWTQSTTKFTPSGTEAEDKLNPLTVDASLLHSEEEHVPPSLLPRWKILKALFG